MYDMVQHVSLQILCYYKRMACLVFNMFMHIIM